MQPFADAHCDFLYGAMEYGYDIRGKRRDQNVTLDRLAAGGVALQFFAVWVDSALRTAQDRQALYMIDHYLRMLEDNAVFTPFTGGFKPESNRIATVLTIEGGEACQGSLAMLRHYRRLGVRAMTLTWNEDNELSDCAVGRKGRGLTGLGREFLAEMNRQGIAMDVAHLSDRGIEDALRLSTAPIFSSHTNARAVTDHPRNLSDELIRAIALQRGVIGVNFYGPQLCATGSAGIGDVVKHIMHVVSVGGIDCCAIGSDFDGMSRYPKGLGSSAELPNLADALLKAGFNSREVHKICYQNLADYISNFV